MGVHERRIAIYHDPVQNSTSSQSSFRVAHQRSVTDKPFECYQILVFDCVAALIDREELKKRTAREDQSKEKSGVREYDAYEGEVGDVPNLIQEVGGSIGTPIFFAITSSFSEAKRSGVGTGNIVKYGGCGKLVK